MNPGETIVVRGTVPPTQDAAALAPLPPVRTRGDCFDWVNEEDVQLEVWTAFRGAVRYFMDYDFDSDVREASGPPGHPGAGLIPGTVLCEDDGQPWQDRSHFLQVLLTGIVWRLEALAERRGVALGGEHGYDGEFKPPLRGGRMLTASEALADQSWLGKYLGGEARQWRFKSKREMQAFMKANGVTQKEVPAGASNTSGTMTNVERTNDDGTNCRP